MGKAARISVLFLPDNTFHSHSIYTLFWMAEQIASNSVITNHLWSTCLTISYHINHNLMSKSNVNLKIIKHNMSAFHLVLMWLLMSVSWAKMAFFWWNL